MNPLWAFALIVLVPFTALILIYLLADWVAKWIMSTPEEK